MKVGRNSLRGLGTYLKSQRSTAHDSLFIKGGVWHYVENVNTTRGCIMLNLHGYNWSRELDYNFGDLWPEQSERCKNNQ